MKRTSILLIAALSLGMTACDDDDNMGIAQKNPVPEIVTVDGFDFAAGEDIADGNLDLNAFASEGTVNLVRYVAGTVPADGTLGYDVQLSDTPDFSGDNVKTVSAPAGVATVADINGVYRDMFGKVANAAKTLYMRVGAYISIRPAGSATAQVSRLGGQDYWFMSGTELQVTPIPSNLPESLYTPGANGSWDFNDANMRLYTTDYTTYEGYVYIQGEWKIAEADWSGINIGYNEAGDALINDGGSKNIPVPADGAGLYHVSINIESMALVTTKVNTIGLIGNGDWDNDGATFTPSADYRTWTAEVTFSDPAAQWKLRVNGAWTFNFGAPGETEPVTIEAGVPSQVVQNGKNFVSAASGACDVTLDLGTFPYTLTVTAK